MDRHMSDALDRHITGNYGADQPADDLHTPGELAAALRAAGIAPDRVTEAPDGVTVVVDPGEGLGTLCLGWTDTEHPDFPAGGDPCDVDWTTYNADHDVEQQDSGTLGQAVSRAVTFVETAAAAAS